MEVNIEDIVKYQVAEKIIGLMPESERRKILEASLVKTLHDALRPWNVEKAIREDIERYMIEYLKKEDVQKRIKIATEKAVDNLMDGVISVIISKSQDGIKSNYEKFVKEQKITDIKSPIKC